MPRLGDRRTMRPRTVGPAMRLVMLCAALLFLQGCTTTMTRSDCSNPRVSNLIAPNAYLVVLPYRYRGSDSSRHDDAERINRVIALQAIRIAADMERTHITLVEGDPDDPQCGIESVYERVVDNRTGLFWRRVFHSAVFLWGEIYDAPDGLTLQTHLRTYWNGPRERTLAVLAECDCRHHRRQHGGEDRAAVASQLATKRQSPVQRSDEAQDDGAVVDRGLLGARAPFDAGCQQHPEQADDERDHARIAGPDGRRRQRGFRVDSLWRGHGLRLSQETPTRASGIDRNDAKCPELT